LALLQYDQIVNQFANPTATIVIILARNPQFDNGFSDGITFSPTQTIIFLPGCEDFSKCVTSPFGPFLSVRILNLSSGPNRRFDFPQEFDVSLRRSKLCDGN